MHSIHQFFPQNFAKRAALHSAVCLLREFTPVHGIDHAVYAHEQFSLGVFGVDALRDGYDPDAGKRESKVPFFVSFATVSKKSMTRTTCRPQFPANNSAAACALTFSNLFQVSSSRRRVSIPTE